MIGQRSSVVRAIEAVLLGIVIFLGCAWLARRLAPLVSENTSLASQCALKLLLIAVSLALWACTRRTWAEMGWKRPCGGVPLVRRYALAALAMGVASIALIWTRSRHPATAGMSFLEIVVAIWLLSSISEEIFVRGLIQSWIAAPSSKEPIGNAERIAVPVSAAFFAGMHVPLIWMGAGAVGGGIIVAATLVVGWAAAELRARTDSLAHAIGVHIFANVAGVPFGILGVLAFKLTYGEMPFAQ
jgi:membrane protease YdiL (CAAX protease family)